jgi:hypothetical protein
MLQPYLCLRDLFSSKLKITVDYCELEVINILYKLFNILLTNHFC